MERIVEHSFYKEILLYSRRKRNIIKISELSYSN